MNPACDATWEEIRGHLRRTVSPAIYDIWLARLEAQEVTEQALVLRAPDRDAGWVADRFARELRESATAVLGPGADVRVLGSSALAPGRAPGPRDPEPNPKFTFGQFVIGEGNRLAHAAALAVAEMPGQAYNPLFIYGPPGVGKTHLLQSIAAYVRGCGETNVVCTTADSFTTDFVAALRSGSIGRFKSSYRGAGVLLVDDVQFLESKARTEEEFFHTFNALHEAGAQLVLTSDRLPRDIAALESRLRERFEGGLVVDIGAPDLRTRITILRKRVEQDGLGRVPEEALELLAARVSDNVRRLEGALIKVVAKSSIKRRTIDAALCEEALAELGRRTQARPRSVREIQDLVCEAFGIAFEDLVSPRRGERLVWPRQLAMYLARAHGSTTLSALGRQFGGRDHTTILHACERAAKRIAADPSAREVAERLEEQLAGAAGDRSG